MKRLLSFIVTLLAVTALCACGQKLVAEEQRGPTWQEQYDLGVRYLSEGNYEEAIIAFTAAIEIEPQQADAYLNMANAYIGMNDFDSAKEILEMGYELTQSQALKDKLDEIESGNISDFWGNVRKNSYFDEFGTLQWYQVYGYNGKQVVSVTTYDASGVQTGYWDGFLYNEQGQESRWMSYGTEDGCVMGYDDFSYDENGRRIRLDCYSLDGTMMGYFEYTYSENGKIAFAYHYAPDGRLTYYSEHVYEGDLLIGTYGYGADGALWWRHEYRYDEDGKNVEIIDYDAEGNILSSEVRAEH